MNEFEGRVALVTGGANGMGRACVRQLAAGGASVVVVDVVEAAAVAAVAEVAAAGGRAEFVLGDVGEPEVIAEAVRVAEAKLGGLDVVVAAAGIPEAGYRSGSGRPRHAKAGLVEGFTEMKPDEWAEVLGVNLRGAMLAVQKGVASMLGREVPGSIVVITSVAAANSTASNNVAYTASKAGAQALVKHVARLVAARGIRVNAVGPGLIDTNMSRSFLASSANSAVLAQIPAGRAGTPDEVAEAVLYLAGDRSSFITGEVLYVDGGQFTG
ncbi:3-oxoacyl-(acyl-carrier protein) reductase [Frankia sp. EI5c]|uniref:SDR family NAD(P)-dependent oxidoreductase n=1 Tax=Frankia sp. EI5c TaxID=683316 RepID=UPI0007C3E7E1|nr:SDR family NAD(P)-dependent oxidoreductase [Frankia sp. EI5c]OAA27427.1 3-oxoacyl-(acyl-carrier protein) reductase [Frankia sp. EI5c]